MSRRIMNEVMDIFNSKNYPIYYTDTDSLHCKKKDLQPVANIYRSLYNKELFGKGLGQFSTDFELDGAVSGSVHAARSIYLGKKSYVDILEGLDTNGNKVFGQHVRLKGITSEGLLDASKKLGGYYELYKHLSKGREVEMVLNPYNFEDENEKVLFEFVNGTVNTRSRFTRKVKFTK